MKIYYDVEQGTGEWFRLRMGIPTASCFDQIVTPAKGQLSKSSVKYAYRLICERLLKAPTESVEGQMWMERGKEIEPQAVKQYEFVNDAETVPVGFITTDDGLIGCSPDRLVLSDRRIGLEIKCPSPHVHLGYLLDGQAEAYRPQVQGQLYVAELERADFYSYHPRMPACTIRTARDESYIKLLGAALRGFNEQLFEMLERAKAMGVFQAHEDAATPLEKEQAAGLREAFRDDVALSP